MRYPAAQKAETHEKIVDAASRSFRERGSDGLGIAPLMDEIGATVGGFYRHFDSKDDLYVEAMERALKQTADWLIAEVSKAPEGQALSVIIERYLSMKHLQSVGAGCVLAALAPEIGRQPEPIRKKINAAMQSYMHRLLPFFPGQTEAERRRHFFLLFPAMAGTMMMARALSEPSIQEEILKSARSFYLDAFVKAKPTKKARRS